MINKDSYYKIKKELPPEAQLVAVSKFISTEVIMELYNEGHRDFGENRPQELCKKMDELPSDIKWHFIGHLQTNKIKYIIDRVYLIHSVDSVRLLEEINRQASRRNNIVKCLLQVYIAKEESKQGLSEQELYEILSDKIKFQNIKFCGLMGMATFTCDKEIVAGEFAYLSALFKRVKEEFFKSDDFFQELSMGMSADYAVAIEHGSTLVRIGSLIFGER